MNSLPLFTKDVDPCLTVDYASIKIVPLILRKLSLMMEFTLIVLIELIIFVVKILCAGKV